MGKPWEGKCWQCEMQPSFPNEPIAAEARHRGSRDAEGSALCDAFSSGSTAPAKVHPLSAEFKAGHWAHSPQSGGKRSQGQAPWCSREGKEALKDQGQAHAPWFRPLEPCKSRGPSAVALETGKGSHAKAWCQEWWHALHALPLLQRGVSPRECGFCRSARR